MKLITFLKKIFFSDILKCLNLPNNKSKIKIFDIKDLINAGPNDVSFFNSIKYLDYLKGSDVKYVITHKKYESLINKFCNPIIVDNVLKSVSVITKLLSWCIKRYDWLFNKTKWKIIYECKIWK